MNSNRIYLLIKAYRNGDKNKIVEVIEIFNPLLNKLHSKGSSDDIKSDLILFMFDLLCKIPLEKEIFCSDKYIISYIKKSLVNEFIRLNKICCRNKDLEFSLDESYVKSKYTTSVYDEIIFKDMIKNLTEREKEIFYKKYVLNYLDSEIARSKNITRQAVYKTHKNAIKKLRKDYQLL